MSLSLADTEATLRAVDKATNELGFCRNRVWAIAKSLLGGPGEFPKLLPSLENSPHETKKEDHQLCTFDFCEQSRVNFTLVTQRHEPPCDGSRCPLENFPSETLEAAVRKEQQITAWYLWETGTLQHNERYMAVSHVWSDGTGTGSQARGDVNSCLLELFQEFALEFNCEGLWWDTICIPTKKELREKALKRMHLNYKAAAVTLVHDCFLREREWRDADLACFYIVMSPWFSRGWTALELKMSQTVQIIFKGPEGPITKDLDRDILQAKSNDCPTTKHELAKDILKRFRREEVDGLDDLLAILSSRHTSWPRDMAIISGLIVGIELPENYPQQKIYQEILQKLGKISHAHLFHNSATMTNGYNWCPTNIYDLPVTLSADVLQIEENGNLFGDWNIISLDFLKDESVVLGHAHPLIEGKVRLAQKEKDKHILLIEPDPTLSETRISRGLLVKPSFRRDKIHFDCYCDYVGPVYFHPPLIRSNIPNFDPNDLFKIHVGKDETTHDGSHQSTERSQNAQSMIEDMKNGLLNPQYRKRESDLKTLDLTAWDQLKLSEELIKAAGEGDYNNTKALLEKIRDPNQSDKSGWSALHHAVWYGQTKVAKLLVKRLNPQQQTASGEEPLHLAADRGNEELMRILLARSTPNLNREDGLNALHLAAMNNVTGIVDELLQKWDINATGVKKQTALHMASFRGHEDVVHVLTKQNAKHDLKDCDQETALSLAVFNGHVNTVRLLKAAKADLDVRDNYGWTLLHRAVNRGHITAIEILAELGANLEAQDNNGWTPLQWAAITGYITAIETLAELGANLNTQDNDSWTPLHRAAIKGHITAIEILAKLGANLEAQDNNSRTPLQCAASNGHIPAIEILAELGANLEAQDNNSRTPLQCAASNGHIPAIEILAELGANLEAQDNDGWTPLQWAAIKGYITAIETLAKLGANLEAQDNNGRTPLQCVASNGHIPAIETLAKLGANLEAQDNDGRTPLQYAAMNGHIPTIETLAKLGANLEAQDNSGRTPLQWAVSNGHVTAVKILCDLKARSQQV